MAASQTFSGATIVVNGVVMRLMEVGPAHTDGDCIVHVPDRHGVYTGYILFVGVTPVAWAGPASRIVSALEQVIALRAKVIVSGHGPLATLADVQSQIDYWDWMQSSLEPFARRLYRSIWHLLARPRIGLPSQLHPIPAGGKARTSRVSSLASCVRERPLCCRRSRSSQGRQRVGSCRSMSIGRRTQPAYSAHPRAVRTGLLLAESGSGEQAGRTSAPAEKHSLKPLRIPQPYADISQWVNCTRNDGLSDRNLRTQQLALRGSNAILLYPLGHPIQKSKCSASGDCRASSSH